MIRALHECSQSRLKCISRRTLPTSFGIRTRETHGDSWERFVCSLLRTRHGLQWRGARESNIGAIRIFSNNSPPSPSFLPSFTAVIGIYSQGIHAFHGGRENFSSPREGPFFTESSRRFPRRAISGRKASFILPDFSPSAPLFPTAFLSRATVRGEKKLNKRECARNGGSYSAPRMYLRVFFRYRGSRRGE